MLEKINFEFLDEKIYKTNSTEFTETDIETIEEIKKLNNLDIKLYEYAKEHLVNYSKNPKEYNYNQKYASLHDLLKEKNQLIYTFNMPIFGANWYYREGPSNTPYVWVRNREGKLRFNLNRHNDYVLYFQAFALKNEMKISVKMNDHIFYPQRMNKETFSLYKVDIPKECLTQELTDISFCATHSYRLRDLDANNCDTRDLSIALNRIEIHPIGSVDDDSIPHLMKK